MRGRFLVLEGIDGCGKTTQLEYLAHWLPQSGLLKDGAQVHLTKEPGGTDLGLALRKLLLDPPGDASPDAIAELLLYSADRAQHVSRFIVPTLEKGDWILSDRFTGSTFAYQGYGRGLNFQTIKTLEAIATNGLTPDLTFLLDLSVQVSILRRSARVDDRIEAEGIDFLSRARFGFLEIARKQDWVVISAEQPKKKVSDVIESQIRLLTDDT